MRTKTDRPPCGRWGIQFRAKGATGWSFERVVLHGCESDDEALARYENWFEGHKGPRCAESRLIYRTADDWTVLATKGLPKTSPES